MVACNFEQGWEHTCVAEYLPFLNEPGYVCGKPVKNEDGVCARHDDQDDTGDGY